MVDVVGECLKEFGVCSYLVEIIGELKVEGCKLDGMFWCIVIEVLCEGQWVVQQVLVLDGYGVLILGDYCNYFEENGQCYLYIFDLCIGVLIDYYLVLVMVIDLLMCNVDGLLILLMVFGLEEGYCFVEKY